MSPQIKNYLEKIIISLIILITLSISVVILQQAGKRFLPKPVNNSSPQGNTQSFVKIALAKNLIDSNAISINKLSINAQIPAYNLPLGLNSITNWQAFNAKISIDDQTKSLLSKNGFAVMDTPQTILATTPGAKDDFVPYYRDLKNKELPIFITTDSLLHYYHIFFDSALMRLEQNLFYDDIWQISQKLLADANQEINNSDPGIKQAAIRNQAYLSVALELLKPKPDQVKIVTDELKAMYCDNLTDTDCQKLLTSLDIDRLRANNYEFFTQAEAQKYQFQVADEVKNIVNTEVDLINQHQGWRASPLFIYQEDYSQYVPRGHYTKSEKLKNYFKALMWYGRMTALIKGSPNLSQNESSCNGMFDGIISQPDAAIQTLQASLMAKNFLQDKEIQEKWQRIYTITSFFVGVSDDLGPIEYRQVLENTLGQDLTTTKIKEKLNDIQQALTNLTYNPKIYSGLGQCALAMSCPPLNDQELQSLKTQAQELLQSTKGFRLLGQRFTVDSYLFSEIVSPYSGQYNGIATSEPFTWVKTEVAGCPEGREVRGFPRGLDIMALFGSSRAYEILKQEGDTNYTDFDKKFNQLKTELDALPPDQWTQNLYWNWLYVLKSLTGPASKGMPSFMQNNAWLDQKLNTALGSWTELRHDTILYVKQSYTMAEMGAGSDEAPVEGYVEPLPEFYQRLFNLTNATKQGLTKLVPINTLDQLNISLVMDNFTKILEKLMDISKKELANQVLNDDDYYFIDNFGSSSDSLIKALFADGVVDQDALKTTLVADVHTDGNSAKVLEQGIGDIKTMVVVYKMPQGNLVIGLGPVFSYYEFKQPMDNRLTDETWRKMLQNNPPQEPQWTNSFSR